MTCSELNDRIDAYAAGTLAPELCRETAAHLEECQCCRDALTSLRTLRANIALLPRGVAPVRDLWPEIAVRLATNEKVPSRRVKALAIGRWVVPLAAAAGVAIATGIFWPRPAATAGWTVAALTGAPRVGDETINGSRPWQVGQWLETDSTSRARFEVGTIGEVQLEPNSRLRLLGTASTDHRIELARGTMHALIWAPPRLFFVETPSATAVDLGCAYTLSVDAHGVGLLEVTAGYVALEHGDHFAIVPAGMSCRTRPRIGPGTPFAATTSPEFRLALDRFDSNAGEDEALAEIVARAGTDDAITLWHLLARVSAVQRGVVFDRLSAFAPPPADVTRPGVLAGDRAMLNSWAAELGLAFEVANGSTE